MDLRDKLYGEITGLIDQAKGATQKDAKKLLRQITSLSNQYKDLTGEHYKYPQSDEQLNDPDYSGW